MDIDQLAKLLRGSNVTVNIIGGTGNTVYTGPVQINHHYAAQSLPDVRCRECGRVLHNENNMRRGICYQCERGALPTSPHYSLPEQRYTIEPVPVRQRYDVTIDRGNNEDMPY